MLVLPLLLMLAVPKLMGSMDPESQKVNDLFVCLFCTRVPSHDGVYSGE